MGSLLGFGLGVLGTLRHAQRQLVQESAFLRDEADAASSEAVNALIKTRASKLLPCSKEEIDFFRGVVFRSKFLKDAGRMSHRMVLCSSMLGHLDKPIPVSDPDFSSAAGTHIFRSLPASATGEVRTVGAQMGGAYVVFSPWIFSNPQVTGTRFAVTIRGKDMAHSGVIAGEVPDLPVETLLKDQQSGPSALLYATRCSSHFLTCATAYRSLRDVVKSERLSESLDVGTGCIFGIAFCALWSAYSKRTRSLEQQLRRAIKSNSFRVLYQPVVDITTRKIIGAEALLRWNDEDGSPVSPDVFIPVAEDKGLIRDITRLVVRHVLTETSQVVNDLPDFRVSINVSRADLLDPDFLPMLKMASSQAGLPMANLAIEVTERDFACNAMTASALKRLRAAGVSVLLDDFGAGYSSLSCLQELEVDAIKIDRAFIRAAGANAITSQGLLPQILAIAEFLKLKVVLEGIETEEQVDYFASLGKPLAGQGWYFGKPLPLEHLRVELQREQRSNIA